MRFTLRDSIFLKNLRYYLPPPCEKCLQCVDLILRLVLLLLLLLLSPRWGDAVGCVLWLQVHQYVEVPTQ
jgi:hypothetical protein